jgi:hypothetical protein
MDLTDQGVGFGVATPGLDESPSPTPTGPSSSKGWLKMIADAEKALHSYQIKSDNIDKQFANLERLAATTRDREIQLFWANISVMAPSIYSRPPIPVVVPRFKSDDELPRTTSEMLERAVTVMFEKETIDGVMRLIRDDLVIVARGASWLRLVGTKRVAIDHADRKDWLCEAARTWKEVDWVAKRSWLTEEAAGKRFSKASGEAYKSLTYSLRKDAESDSNDGSSKAGIWEIWCKSQNKVVWVSEGAAVCLDEGPPHLDLEGFFPCPRPAFATLERRSLVPVPDMLFYKDQLEEINEITDRIAALTEAVRVRGFYSSGGGDVADAIEAAFKATSNNTIIIPIANLSGLNGVALKDAIAWLPIEVIGATITSLVALRKELIQDVYEVTGLSDIMRGQTEAGETLGAQQLKSQYGSVRVKDRQDELTRVACDITRITAEIMAENFSGTTLMEMSQIHLPSDADIEAKAKPLQAQMEALQKQLEAIAKHAGPLQQKVQQLQQEVQGAAQDPEVKQFAAANPDKAKAIVGAVQQQLQQDQAQLQQLEQQGQPLQQHLQQMQQQLQQLEATVTIDKVTKLLREKKLRPFILDIETDSTIAPDENAAKQRAAEFTTAIGGFLKEALPLVAENPQAAPMVAETLKFIVKQYRAGRELQGVIDKFADNMKAKAAAPPPPNPEAQKAQSDAAATQAKQQLDEATAQAKQQHDAATLQLATAKQQFDEQQAAVKGQNDAQAAKDTHELAQQKLHLDAQIATAKTAETTQKHALEQQKTLAAAAEADQKHALEMRKAELAALTSIEVAQIGAKQAMDAIELTKKLEADLALETQAREHAHKETLAASAQEAAVKVAAAKPQPAAPAAPGAK